MKKALFFPLQVSLCTVSCLYASSSITQAQVTSDGTLDTQVTQDGNVAEITGGETRGSNLFHSFQDFSVSTVNEAFFNNANDISNIFSRVTGGNISNIDGLIRANDSASLFLINPAGIIFGQNARLDIGGSFYGSTASSILFEDGEFSAADLENPPLLTVNAPIGLGFRDNPGDIENNSTVNNGNGLEVETGNNIALLGGNIRFNGGRIFAPGGNVQLGSLTDSGTVGILDNGSFSFPNNIERGNISLINSAAVGIFAAGGGSIEINTKNLEITSGSFISAGIASNLGSPDAQAGDITINATDSVVVEGIDSDFFSSISNRVFDNAIGNSGNIEITTDSLSLINGGFISTNLSGQGAAGNVNITASKDIAINGQNNNNTGLFNLVNNNGVGTGADIDLNTGTLTISNAAQINSNVFGTGNAGSINIKASDSLVLTNNGFIVSDLQALAIGNSGNLEINTSSLSLSGESRISSSTLGQGNAGNLNINASDSISVSDSSAISAIVTDSGIGNGGEITLITTELNLTDSLVSVSTLGRGNAGNLNIDASNSISVSNGSGISAVVTDSGIGNGGEVNVNTTSLSIADGSLINSTTLGIGNAGNISIQTENIDISNNSDSVTGIFTFVNTNATGDGGQIDIDTENLNISNNNSFISTSTLGEGDAGIIDILATESINLSSRANIWAIVFESGVGNAGSVNIEAASLKFDDFSKVSVESFGRGNSGSLVVNADFINLLDGSQIIGSIEGTGNGGDLTVNAGTIEIVDSFGEGSIRPTGIVSNVNRGGEGNGGSIDITAKNIRLDGLRAEISTSVFGEGNAGQLSITATESIDITNLAGIFSDIFNDENTGIGGSLNINASNLNLNSRGTISVNNQGQGNAGILTIDTDILNILNGSVTGNVSGAGDGADIFINANSIQIDDLVSQIGTSSLTSISADIGFEASGDGGNITITTEELKLNGFNSRISSSLSSGTSSGSGGILDINASKFILIEGTSFASSSNTGIFASVLEAEASGNSGNVNINTPLLLLDDGTISVNNTGRGNGGELSIKADSIDLNNNSQLIAETFSGEGASIILDSSEDLILQGNSLISAQAFNDSNGGNLSIDSRFVIAFPDGNNDILASAEQGQGGNITINAESLLGIQERTPSNLTNDINASSQVSGLDGTISISAPDTNPIQGAAELPTDVIVPEETSQQACEANREIAAKNGLNITGKGGIVPEPGLPLNSLNIAVNGETNSTSVIPQPIETSQGKIQPARGIKVTESGKVILTAYRTNNSGDRLPEIKSNCD